jgi:hypothetical protein
MSPYEKAGHRIQTALAILWSNDPGLSLTQPKHMRTGIDLSKSDMGGLASLLIAKGVFTKDEYVEAITKAAEQEADSYEKMVQTILSNRNIQTR